MLDIWLVKMIFKQSLEEVRSREKNALVAKYWVATFIDQFDIAQSGIIQIPPK